MGRWASLCSAHPTRRPPNTLILTLPDAVRLPRAVPGLDGLTGGEGAGMVESEVEKAAKVCAGGVQRLVAGKMPLVRKVAAV
jgi:hypothetical protein